MSAARRVDAVVICPLAFEAKPIRAALRRAGREDVRVVVCGPGPEAARRAVREAAARAQNGRPLLVLAGVAGGLAGVEDVPRVSRVIDAQGRRWPCPTLHGHGGWEVGAPDGVMLLGLDSPLASAESKREWGARTGAGMVDTESHAFAAACEEHGFAGRWAIVRGVSDGHDETLPHQVVYWVDGAGRTRLGRVLMDLARRPRLASAALRLGRRSGRVLPRVAQRVLELVRAGDGGAGKGATEADGGITAGPPALITPLDVERGAPLAIIFGGAFDPPHRAHVELAALAREEVEKRLGIAGKAWLIYVPAALSPLKERGPLAAAEHRVAMLRLATAGLERAVVWTDEVDRGGGESYTIDTVRRAREWLDRHGGETTGLRLLIGADQARQFHRWREPREIMRLAEPIVLLRARQGGTDPGGDEVHELERDLGAGGAWSAGEIRDWLGRVVTRTTVDLSSTEARSRLAGDDTPGDGLGGLLDGPVLEYIRQNGLYKAQDRI